MRNQQINFQVGVKAKPKIPLTYLMSPTSLSPISVCYIPGASKENKTDGNVSQLGNPTQIDKYLICPIRNCHTFA